MYKKKELTFNFKPKKKSSNTFFKYNSGKLCYLIKFSDCNFLTLYDKKLRVLYKVLNSDKEGTKQYFLKELVSACETIIVGSVTFFKEILSFTFIGVKETFSLNTNDYINFFTSKMKEISIESKKVNMKFHEESLYCYHPSSWPQLHYQNS